MELRKLQQYVRLLVTLEETDSPVISCYLNLQAGMPPAREFLNDRAQLIRNSLCGKARRDFEMALLRIQEYIALDLPSSIQGVAIFARGGLKPLFLPVEFHIPVPNWFVMNSTPNVYHLVELKDTYHRFVIMICSAEKVRILEVNLGAVTEQVWKERPDLRKRVGRGWTKQRYQRRWQNQIEQFIKESVQILEELIRARGHTHLVLAGNRRITARVRATLPWHVTAKLIDTLDHSRSEISKVVAAAIASFVEQEEAESQAAVARLLQGIHSNGLAVAGSADTLKALEEFRADMVIIAKEYNPDPGWSCTACGALGPDAAVPSNECPQCGAQRLRAIDLKEEMARMAEACGCTVEVVNSSKILKQLGGIGALLRYTQVSNPRRDLVQT